MEAFIDGMRGITSAEVSYTWIEDYEFLTEHNFTFAIPWIMPVGNNFWVPKEFLWLEPRNWSYLPLYCRHGIRHFGVVSLRCYDR
ncbi:MAG: hypothetical protein Ct9H300mP15_13950 [Gemmatimonadota bacterium]|nr:MAG: hypothetical protein Ct9H300mP15_13950 [Gemmatimonadota bacterium]